MVVWDPCLCAEPVFACPTMANTFKNDRAAWELCAYYFWALKLWLRDPALTWTLDSSAWISACKPGKTSVGLQHEEGYTWFKGKMCKYLRHLRLRPGSEWDSDLKALAGSCFSNMLRPNMLWSERLFHSFLHDLIHRWHCVLLPTMQEAAVSRARVVCKICQAGAVHVAIRVGASKLEKFQVVCYPSFSRIRVLMLIRAWKGPINWFIARVLHLSSAPSVARLQIWHRWRKNTAQEWHGKPKKRNGKPKKRARTRKNAREFLAPLKLQKPGFWTLFLLAKKTKTVASILPNPSEPNITSECMWMIS